MIISDCDAVKSQCLDFSFIFREIFRILDLMKADMVNFRIVNLRPVLQRQSVEYERATFQSILEKTPSTQHFDHS